MAPTRALGAGRGRDGRRAGALFSVVAGASGARRGAVALARGGKPAWRGAARLVGGRGLCARHAFLDHRPVSGGPGAPWLDGAFCALGHGGGAGAHLRGGDGAGALAGLEHAEPGAGAYPGLAAGRAFPRLWADRVSLGALGVALARDAGGANGSALGGAWARGDDALPADGADGAAGAARACRGGGFAVAGARGGWPCRKSPPGRW